MLRLAGIAFDPHTTLKELHDRVDLGISPRDKATQDNAPPKQGVTLSTIHAAKGGEWQYVLVLDIYDENLSRNGELDVDDEAEFRVFHVALTRAKHQTYLFTLKHEAYVDALSLNREGQPNVTNIAAVNKHQYSTLRFLPPYPDVKRLCSYERAKRIKLDQKDPLSQPQQAAPAKPRTRQTARRARVRRSQPVYFIACTVMGILVTTMAPNIITVKATPFTPSQSPLLSMHSVSHSKPYLLLVA